MVSGGDGVSVEGEPGGVALGFVESAEAVGGVSGERGGFVVEGGGSADGAGGVEEPVGVAVTGREGEVAGEGCGEVWALVGAASRSLMAVLPAAVLPQHAVESCSERITGDLNPHGADLRLLKHPC
jgi:hypothetical protein